MNGQRKLSQCVCCGSKVYDVVALPNSGTNVCLDCWMEMETEAPAHPIPSPPNPNEFRDVMNGIHIPTGQVLSVEAMLRAMECSN